MMARKRGHCVMAVGARVSCMVKIDVYVCMYVCFGALGYLDVLVYGMNLWQRIQASVRLAGVWKRCLGILDRDLGSGSYIETGSFGPSAFAHDVLAINDSRNEASATSAS